MNRFWAAPQKPRTLAEIRAAAKVRHEKERKVAQKSGRKNFPMLPFECSWAYELQFNREAEMGVDGVPRL